MIVTLTQIMILVDEYTAYLESKSCQFNDDGLPILGKECFLKDWPDNVVPFRNRKSRLVNNPKRTVLCFYCGDGRIYPRLEKVLRELPEYRKYMGIISPDVTVTSDMDEEWQREIMLLNQLFMAVLAVNKTKVVLNLRSGTRSTFSCFNEVPPNVMCASGTLGCAPIKFEYDMNYLEKILTVRPSGVLIYGKSDSIMEAQLDTFGIPYRRYDDIHAIMKRKQRLVGRP